MTCRFTQSEGTSRASVSRTASTSCVLAELSTDPPRLWMMPVDFGFCKTRTYTSGNVEVLCVQGSTELSPRPTHRSFLPFHEKARPTGSIVFDFCHTTLPRQACQRPAENMLWVSKSSFHRYGATARCLPAGCKNDCTVQYCSMVFGHNTPTS